MDTVVNKMFVVFLLVATFYLLYMYQNNRLKTIKMPKLIFDGEKDETSLGSLIEYENDNEDESLFE